MNIKQQMTIADDVLSRVETLDPTCIIAGGAPRDWLFGNLASDLDIFLYWRPDLQLFYYEKELENLLLSVHRRDYRSMEVKYEYIRNPNLMTVHEGVHMGVNIQLIRMNAPTFKSVIPHFPLDICKAWYKNGEIHTTHEFDVAKEHKVLKVTNKLYANGDAYIQKIKNKFPDFLFIE